MRGARKRLDRDAFVDFARAMDTLLDRIVVDAIALVDAKVPRPSCGDCSNRGRHIYGMSACAYAPRISAAAPADGLREERERRLVNLDFARWNQIGKWLRRVEALRDAA